MTKFNRASEVLWLFGIIFVALGVSICSSANLGVSMIAAPAFVISEALVEVCPFFTVGVTEYAIQGLLLVILCIVVRRFNWRFLLVFLVAVIYGYTLDLFLWILGGVSFDAIWLRWIMLIVGDFFTAFGVACFFRTYMPLQVYELFVSEVAGCFRLPVGRTKWAFDIALLVLSVVLALVLFGDIASFDLANIFSTSFHSIGLGTLVTTAINSPLISLMGKLIDKFFGTAPLFPKLEMVLKRS